MVLFHKETGRVWQRERENDNERESSRERENDNERKRSRERENDNERKRSRERERALSCELLGHQRPEAVSVLACEPLPIEVVS